MKVFVPFFDDAVEHSALRGAQLVPFEHGYTMLHIDRARAGDPLPEPGHAQILPPEDWPKSKTARRVRH